VRKSFDLHGSCYTTPGLENTPVGEYPRTVLLHPGEPFHAAPLVPRQRLVLASGPLLELSINVPRQLSHRLASQKPGGRALDHSTGESRLRAYGVKTGRSALGCRRHAIKAPVSSFNSFLGERPARWRKVDAELPSGVLVAMGSRPGLARLYAKHSGKKKRPGCQRMPGLNSSGLPRPVYQIVQEASWRALSRACFLHAGVRVLSSSTNCA
jgi:hypothetical protein